MRCWRGSGMHALTRKPYPGSGPALNSPPSKRDPLAHADDAMPGAGQPGGQAVAPATSRGPRGRRDQHVQAGFQQQAAAGRRGGRVLR